MPCPQGRYWLATISCQHLPDQPVLCSPICYLKGQKEQGEGGFLHWQVLAVTSKRCTLAMVKKALHQTAHVELSRSEAADQYVWKEDTRVPDTQFELGSKPLSRARKDDWEKIFQSAKAGSFDDIPKDILIRNYSALKRIRIDNMVPIHREAVDVRVYWGVTGAGKTHRVHSELCTLGLEYYDKHPLTKWWDGYRGQPAVVIDEFAGRIDIVHLLRWLDKYPVTVEVKGYAVPLEAKHFWITSNINPIDWYPDANENHKRALMRRLSQVIEFKDPFNIRSA